MNESSDIFVNKQNKKTTNYELKDVHKLEIHKQL